MLRTLRLEGFKAFRELILPLGDLTVLTGINSSGKSSVLQAIALVRQSFAAGVGRESLVLNGELIQLGTGVDVLNERSGVQALAIGLSTEETSFSWWRASVPLQADYLTLTAPPENIDAAMEQVVAGSPFQYIRADRVSPEVVYPKSHEMVVRRRSLGARGEYTAHYLSEFRDEPTRTELRAAPNDRRSRVGLLATVETWMSDISPGTRIEVSDLKGTDFVQIRYGLGPSAGISGSQSYRPTHVGFGLMYALPIVTACVGTADGGLIALENPEAHIHPRGQAALGQLLSRSAATGLQVIVETHSDHILNGVRLAIKRGLVEPSRVRIHFFSQSKEGVTVTSPRIGVDGHLSEWPDNFFDQWDRDLDALLE